MSAILVIYSVILYSNHFSFIRYFLQWYLLAPIISLPKSPQLINFAFRD